MKCYKCTCYPAKFDDWRIIRITDRDRIVRCKTCKEVWHTTASYAVEIPVELISEYEWNRQILPSYHYHKREDGEAVLSDSLELETDVRAAVLRENEEIKRILQNIKSHNVSDPLLGNELYDHI